MSDSDEEDMILDIDIVKEVCGNCNQVASILLRRILVTNRRTDDDTPPQYILVSTALLESFYLKSRDEIDVGLCQECAEVFTILFNSQREFGQLRGNGSVVDALIISNHSSSSFKNHRGLVDDESPGKGLTPQPQPLVKHEIGSDGDRSDEDCRNNYCEEDIPSMSDNSGESEDDYAISPTWTSRTNTGYQYQSFEQPSSAVEFHGGRKAAVVAASNIKKTNEKSGSDSDESELGDHHWRPTMRNGEDLERKRIKIEGVSEGNNHLDAEAINGNRKEISDDGDEALEDSCDMNDMIEMNPLLHVETTLADEDITFSKPKYRPGPLRYKKFTAQNGRPRPGPLSSKSSSIRIPVQCIKGETKSDEDLPIDTYNNNPAQCVNENGMSDSDQSSHDSHDSREVFSPNSVTRPRTGCPACSNTFYKISTLKIHYRKVHGGTVPDLALHRMYADGKQQLHCAVVLCSLHKSTKSATRPRTGCPSCSNTYYKISTLRKHYSKVHGGTVPDLAFSTLSDDRKQLQEASSSESTSRPRNQCPACSNTYYKMSTLKLHYERAHRFDAPNCILPW